VTYFVTGLLASAVRC